MMDYDDLLRHLKEFGKYQIYITTLTTIIWYAHVYNHLGIIFLADTPDYHCSNGHKYNSSDPFIAKYRFDNSEGENYTTLKKCHVTAHSGRDLIVNGDDYLDVNVSKTQIINGTNDLYSDRAACTSWQFDRSQYQSTVVTEWDLVCDKRWMVSIASSVYMAGVLIGVYIFGIVSDKIGRRKTLLITMTGMMSMQFAAAFSTSMLMFTVFRFFLGFFTQAMVSASYVIAIEVCGPTWRLIPWLTHKCMWSFFVMVLAGIAYGVRSWRTLQLIFAAQSVPLLLLFIIIPESPRWLYANGQRIVADKLVEKMAKWNGTENKLPDKIHIKVKDTQKANVWDLVRTPVIRRRSLIVFFYWFVTSLVYFGLALNIGKLGGSIYLNLLIAGALELVKDILLYPLVNHLGRKIPNAGTMIVAGLCLLSTVVLPSSQWTAILVLSILGRVAIAGSFNMAYLCSAEMFPTLLRSGAVGTSSMFARVGGILAPIIGQLDEFHVMIPPVAFGSLALLAGILALLLPESKGTKLPDTVDDIENPKRNPTDELVAEHGGDELLERKSTHI